MNPYPSLRIADVEVRYTTYNAFSSSAFFETYEDAERARISLLKLKHVSRAEIVEL
jgi:hypothetical protein